MKKTVTRPWKSWLAWMLTGLWILLAGWLQFFTPDRPTVYAGYQLSSGDPCETTSGYTKPSFAERYACATSRRLGENQAMFIKGIGKALVVIGPPALFWLAFTRYRRRQHAPKATAG